MIDWLRTPTRLTFRTAAAARRARAFHPRGAAYRAVAMLAPPAAISGFPEGRFEAVVRLSRGAGLPDALPDVSGIAVKLLEACGPSCDQDLLLSSTGRSVVGRHLLRPTRGLAGVLHSTLLPYDAEGRRVVIGATMPAVPTVPFGPLVDLLAAEGGRIEVLVAEVGQGWAPMGAVEVRPERLAADDERGLSFDPWHTASTFVPAGRLNALRRPAYVGSRQGRPGGVAEEPRPGGTTASRTTPG